MIGKLLRLLCFEWLRLLFSFCEMTTRMTFVSVCVVKTCWTHAETSFHVRLFQSIQSKSIVLLHPRNETVSFRHDRRAKRLGRKKDGYDVMRKYGERIFFSRWQVFEFSNLFVLSVCPSYVIHVSFPHQTSFRDQNANLPKSNTSLSFVYLLLGLGGERGNLL